MADIAMAHHQSRRMSLVESVTNVVTGYLIALVVQVLVYPLFDIHVSMAQNAAIAAIFMAVGIARHYILRRLFELFR